MSFGVLQEMKELTRQVKAIKGTIEGITVELKSMPMEPLMVEIKGEILQMLWDEGNESLMRLEAHTGSHIHRQAFITSYAEARLELKKLRSEQSLTLFGQEPPNRKQSGGEAKSQRPAPTTQPVPSTSTSNPDDGAARKRTMNLILRTFCSYCDLLGHVGSKCPEMDNRSPRARMEFILAKKKCINCMSKKHAGPQCPRTKRCQRCGKKHDTKLHIDNVCVTPSQAPSTKSVP